MKDRNKQVNLFIKHMEQSDAMAYNMDYVAAKTVAEFGVLNKTYENTGKLYAQLKTKIDNNQCDSFNCRWETEQLLRLENAPQKSLDFLSNVMAQLNVTEDKYYDIYQNSAYTVANKIMTKKAGFGKNEGYDVIINLLEDGGQEIIFTGPFFEKPLIINSTTLEGLLNAGSNLVATTPDINKEMLSLLSGLGVLAAGSNNPETGELTPQAKISEEFILTNADGTYDYEIIDIGNGKGRNILQFDIDKIMRKADPLINSEVAGLLATEQEAVAAWNVFLAHLSSEEEDDQMVQNANAGDLSWSYEEVLPLSQDHKIMLEEKYKQYFYKNYLLQFTTNQIPTVQADAAVFDLEQGKKQKADKFLKDNNLN
tara:strand:- start:13774 stop:14877 length:1104 start_codon:yes stop_codon:yes gene_type:complete